MIWRTVGSQRCFLSSQHLPTNCKCGEGELVSRVHTLVGRSAQVVYELQVLKEGENVREEVQEIDRESQGEEKRSREYDHVDGVKDSTLEPRCVCR